MKSLLKYGFIVLCIPINIRAQENKKVTDSAMMLRDSVVYKSVDKNSERSKQDSVKYTTVEKYSRRSKAARFIYKALFRPLGTEENPELSEKEMVEASYHLKSQGRIIRNIKIHTLDPFGYSISDSSIVPGNKPMQAGNFLHPKTKPSVIKNLLLFSENQRYDSMFVKESERLIRSRSFIRDVFLTTSQVSDDSVDIYLRALDVWSLIPAAGVSASSVSVSFKDLNFAGSGHLLEVSSLWKKPGGTNITRLGYLMPNIKNTYTSLNLQYHFSPNSNILETGNFDNFFYSPVSYDPQYLFSENNNILKSIEINRPFYSPVAKWAGGVFLGQMLTTQSYMADTLRFVSQKTNIQDYWIGRSWQLNRWETNSDRITSLVVAGRLIKTINPARSTESVDAGIFSDQTYYFASINLISRKYFRDRYIFNYGKTEDVPGGRSAGITIGKEYQQQNRFYVGLNTSMGTFYGFGYLGAQLSYGTFRGPEGFQQGMVSGRLTYFTRLLSVGNWRIRQFVRPSFIFGIHRLPADNQPLKIGIKGFEAIESHASNLAVVSLQTQSYAPWNLAGFHFGPYFFSHLGIISREPVSVEVRKSNIYSLMGLGILIKNDYLMFRTFQVSVSFYPYIPGTGNNIFRANAYKTTDYGFRDFEVLKPGIIE
jgi:hypothetical protein